MTIFTISAKDYNHRYKGGGSEAAGDLERSELRKTKRKRPLRIPVACIYLAFSRKITMTGSVKV